MFTFGPTGEAGAPSCQLALGPPGAGPTDPDEGFGPVDGKVWPLALCGDWRVPARAVFTPLSGIADNNAMLAKIKIVPALVRAVIKEEEFFFIKRSPKCKSDVYGQIYGCTFSSDGERESDVVRCRLYM
jgi:hypothetical protein